LAGNIIQLSLLPTSINDDDGPEPSSQALPASRMVTAHPPIAPI
jgi:hypothetical protein